MSRADEGKKNVQVPEFCSSYECSYLRNENIGATFAEPDSAHSHKTFRDYCTAFVFAEIENSYCGSKRQSLMQHLIVNVVVGVFGRDFTVFRKHEFRSEKTDEFAAVFFDEIDFSALVDVASDSQPAVVARYRRSRNVFQKSCEVAFELVRLAKSVVYFIDCRSQNDAPFEAVYDEHVAVVKQMDEVGNSHDRRDFERTEHHS